MAWIALTFDFASKLTSTKMTQLFDNLAAMAAGDSGAPSIDEAAMGAASVNQAALKTTEGSVSMVSTGSSIMAGGAYGFYPRIRIAANGNWDWQIALGFQTFGTTLNKIFMTENSGTTTAYAYQQYFQSSPPYDLGDGEVPLFIFVTLDGAGKIEAVYCAPDPPWANNGPTDIRPTRHDGERKYQVRKIPPPRPADPANPTKSEVDAYVAALANPQFEEIEITQAIKQADMPLIPHPFTGNDLTGKTVVLLDPVSPLTAKLAELNDAGESINELLHDGWLRIDNTALSRATPPGVAAHAPKWRSS